LNLLLISLVQIRAEQYRHHAASSLHHEFTEQVQEIHQLIVITPLS